jgi:hypothetical protein
VISHWLKRARAARAPWSRGGTGTHESPEHQDVEARVIPWFGEGAVPVVRWCTHASIQHAGTSGWAEMVHCSLRPFVGMLRPPMPAAGVDLDFGPDEDWLVFRADPDARALVRSRRPHSPGERPGAG